MTLPDGRVLLATGDALPLGADGRAAPQDPAEHVSKLLIINPDDGSIEVAAQGVRNVQHMELVPNYDPYEVAVGFADIGGVTAEEVNYVPLQDLLDTSIIENFGWGRNPDGLAREGTFYIKPGLPLVLNTQPPVDALAPSPEAGFIQPQAQYGRNDPNGGVAVSGPVTSLVSFTTITGLFSDLSSGIVYATTDPITETNVPVFKVNLIDENGFPLDSLQELAGGRADPRFFRFPDGTAGVLLEATGDFFRLTEIKQFTLNLNPDNINENERTELTGTIDGLNAGSDVTVTINWGDPNDPTNTETKVTADDNGNATFTATHQYLDDGKAPGNNTSSDFAEITVTVIDDDTGEDTETITTTVKNVAPALEDVLINARKIESGGDDDGDEGLLLTFEGAFTDPGTLDIHTGTIHLGDDLFSKELIIDQSTDTFTAEFIFSEDALEEAFPEFEIDELEGTVLDDDFIQIGGTIKVSDDDLDQASFGFEILVGEEGGVIPLNG